MSDPLTITATVEPGPDNTQKIKLDPTELANAVASITSTTTTVPVPGSLGNPAGLSAEDAPSDSDPRLSERGAAGLAEPVSGQAAEPEQSEQGDEEERQSLLQESEYGYEPLAQGLESDEEAEGGNAPGKLPPGQVNPRQTPISPELPSGSTALQGGRKSRKRTNCKRNCRKSRKRTNCKRNCRKSRKGKKKNCRKRKSRKRTDCKRNCRKGTKKRNCRKRTNSKSRKRTDCKRNCRTRKR